MWGFNSKDVLEKCWFISGTTGHSDLNVLAYHGRVAEPNVCTASSNQNLVTVIEMKAQLLQDELVNHDNERALANLTQLLNACDALALKLGAEMCESPATTLKGAFVPCPWCGAEITLSQDGYFPKHVQETDGDICPNSDISMLDPLLKVKE